MKPHGVWYFVSLCLSLVLATGSASAGSERDLASGTYTMEIVQTFPVHVERDGDQVRMIMPKYVKREYKGTVSGADVELGNEKDTVVYKGTIRADNTAGGVIVYPFRGEGPKGTWRLYKE